MNLRVTIAMCLLALTTAGVAQAQTPQSVQVQAPTQTAPADAQAEAAQPPVPAETDVFDLLKRLLRKPPSPEKVRHYRELILAVMPSMGYKPSTGFTFGASGNMAKFFGPPLTTHISSAVVGLSFSTKKQTSFNLKFTASSENDTIRFDGDNRFQWTSQDTYGLGGETKTEDALNAKFTFLRLYETAYYEVTNGLFVGLGVDVSSHSNIEPGEGAAESWDTSPYVEYSKLHGFDLEAQTSIGPSLNVMLDTRDHAINASKGWLANLSYRPFFKNVFGSDSEWQEVVFDVRTFLKTRKDGRQKLAFWLYGDLVTSGVAPYFDLPTLGMDTYGRSGRGYSEGRFRGERLLYGEAEYRATLTRSGLLGMVVFANATTVANRQAEEHLFDAIQPGGGIGLRVLFSKRSKTNICIDYAWGKGSKGLYLALQEAF